MGIMDGLCNLFFSNGQLMMESYYINNKKEKNCIYYYPSGIISHKGNYISGIKSGKWEYFNDEGVIDTIINYNE